MASVKYHDYFGFTYEAHILACCRGKKSRKTVKGYLWKLSKERNDDLLASQ